MNPKRQTLAIRRRADPTRIAMTAFALAFPNTKETLTTDVDLSASLARTVLETGPACVTNARTRAPARAVKTQFATLSITYQCAIVHRECLETLSSTADQCRVRSMTMPFATNTLTYARFVAISFSLVTSVTLISENFAPEQLQS